MLSTLLPLLLTCAPQARPDAQLELTPIQAGTENHLRIRTTIPGGPALLLLAGTSTPTASPIPGLLPSISLPIDSTLMSVMMDADGRLDLVTQVTPGLLPAGLQLRAQALLLNQAGKFVMTNAAMTTVEPAAPGSFFASAPPSYLPASAINLNAFASSACDIDLDGRPDLLITTDTGPQIWSNTPSGSGFILSHSPAALAVLPALGFVSSFGDVNNDGYPDLVFGPAADAGGLSLPGRVLLNDQNGHFVPGSTFLGTAGDSVDLALADIDHDGDLDLFVAMGADPHSGTGGAVDRLLWNDGAGNFTDDVGFANAVFNDPVTSTTSVALGDINNDGYPEILLGKTDLLGQVGGFGQQNQLIFYLAHDSFLDFTAIAMPAMDDNTDDIEFVDVDGDGDLDIVAANIRSSISAANSGDLLINQGGSQNGTLGQFLDVQDGGLENVSGELIRLGVTTADVDNDGDMDILFAVHDLPPSSLQPLYLNQGGAQAGTPGSFLRATWFTPGNLVVHQPTFVDLDVDGDVDLVLPASGSLSGDPKAGDLQLLLNSTSL